MDRILEPIKTRKAQIRPPVEAAIQLIVQRGLTIVEAAEMAGMQGPSLQKALKKPHVSARLASVKRAWMDSEISKAWITVAGLATGAASEDTRLKAARTILEAAGELTTNRRDDGAGAKQLVQIVIGTRDDRSGVTVLAGEHDGVIESPPYVPGVKAGPDDGE